MCNKNEKRAVFDWPLYIRPRWASKSNNCICCRSLSHIVPKLSERQTSSFYFSRWSHLNLRKTSVKSIKSQICKRYSTSTQQESLIWSSWDISEKHVDADVQRNLQDRVLLAGKEAVENSDCVRCATNSSTYKDYETKKKSSCCAFCNDRRL